VSDLTDSLFREAGRLKAASDISVENQKRLKKTMADMEAG
jgi:hypothetical protein